MRTRHLPLGMLLVAVLLLAGCTAGVDAATAEPKDVVTPPPPPVPATPAPPPSPTDPAAGDGTPAPPADAATTAPADDPPAAPAATPSPPPELADCAPLVVLGVRGSGQPPGLGAEVADVVAELRARLGADAVSGEAVVYPASPIGGAIFDPGRFTEGVRSGGVALQAQTADIGRRCPDSAVAWVGYSQGALVLREAMEAGPPPDEVGVNAAVLLADPARDPGDPADRGPAPGPADPDAGPAGRGPLPAAWTAVAASWCVVGDPICDRSAPASLDGLVQHAEGYRAQGITAAAADDLVDRLDG